jgi:hypothetical protein
MRVAAGVLGLALVLLVLAEFFVAFLLPRRVKRDPRLARRFLLIVWRPWRALATRMSASTADTALGIFGPFGLLAMLGLWSAGLILGFAGMYWSIHPHFDAGEAASFGDDLYFSASAFFSASTIFDPEGGVARFLQIAEAACGFGVLFIAIGYLPALFQAFSTRETAVSQLDPRAGSPPTAGTLLERSAERGGWEELDEYLGEWETWAAELMETHLLPVPARQPELARRADDRGRHLCLRHRIRARWRGQRSRVHLCDRSPCARRPRPLLSRTDLN